MNWLGLTLLGGVANGINNVVIKYFSHRADILLIIAANMVLTACFVAVFALYSQKARPVVDGQFLLATGAATFFGTILVICFVLAASKGPISLISPLFGAILNTTAAVLGIILFAEKITWMTGGGILLTMLGAFMIGFGS
jgi:drug/metabolite transporter (DMT)-like permease